MSKVSTKLKGLTKKVIGWVKVNPKEFTILLVILLVASVLRLYRIDEYMTFLGDEGRDVIVVRRLLVNFDPILVGPGTSIGNMYLGPLYYYMMAPALFLAGYSPAGPAILVALLGVATVFFVWYVARVWFGPTAGVVASALYAVSPTVIIYSRSSWNPNIMPFFALLTVYAVWKMWERKEFGWLIVAGVSFAAMLQSHYLGLLLAPFIFLYWTLTFLKSRAAKPDIARFMKHSFISLGFFALLMSPLLLFDARHGWRNFTAMTEFFLKRQTTVSARPWNAIPELPALATEISTRLVGARDERVGIAVLVTLALALFFLILNRKSLKKDAVSGYMVLFAWLGFALIGLGLYKQEIYDHYYGFFFAAPFLFMGGVSEVITQRFKKVGIFLVGLTVGALVVFNLMESPLTETPNRQLQRTEEIAEKVALEAGGERFNLAVLAERNYEGAYLYFLEAWSAPVVAIDPQLADETITEQLFVICELPREKCEPTSNPKAEVANFGWSKIEMEWQVSGVTLFRLIHNK